MSTKQQVGLELILVFIEHFGGMTRYLREALDRLKYALFVQLNRADGIDLQPTTLHPTPVPVPHEPRCFPMLPVTSRAGMFCMPNFESACCVSWRPCAGHSRLSATSNRQLRASKKRRRSAVDSNLKAETKTQTMNSMEEWTGGGMSHLDGMQGPPFVAPRG